MVGATKLWALFVPQGLNGIEVRRFHRRQHSTYDADKGKDDRRDDQRHGIDDQPDIRGVSMLRDGAVERDAADAEGNGVGKNNSQDASGKGNGESFCEKLDEDIFLTGA